MEYRTWPEILSEWNVKYFLGFRKTVEEKASEAWEFAKQIPLSYALPITLLVSSAIGLSYNYESERNRGIPLAFSEKSQIKKDASKERGKVEELTEFLTSDNDSNMKIFERWNKAHKKGVGDAIKEFAKQLYDEKTNNKFHYSIHELQENLSKESRAALDSLRQYREVRDRLIPIKNLFESTWSDNHIDTTHTESRTGTRTVSDGNGKSHTETYTYYEEVYDYTTHYYTYYRANGEKASMTIDSLFADHPMLKLNQRMRRASKVNKENAQAMHESRAKELESRKDKKLSRIEMLTLANKWLDGSTLMINLPGIHQYYNDNLSRDADNWRFAKQMAHSTSYRTYRHSDSGPKEFQVVENALYNGRNTVNLIRQIEKGIIYTLNNSSLLDRKITELIKTNFGPENGEKTSLRKKLAKEVMSIAREDYKLNFKEGFDVTGFRGWMVALWGILGAAAGAGIGFGIERYKESQGYGSYNRYSRYGRY